MTTQAWNELGILWKKQYMIIVIKYCIVMILLKRLELSTALVLVLSALEARDFECQGASRVEF